MPQQSRDSPATGGTIATAVFLQQPASTHTKIQDTMLKPLANCSQANPLLQDETLSASYERPSNSSTTSTSTNLRT